MKRKKGKRSILNYHDDLDLDNLEDDDDDDDDFVCKSMTKKKKNMADCLSSDSEDESFMGSDSGDDENGESESEDDSGDDDDEEDEEGESDDEEDDEDDEDDESGDSEEDEMELGFIKNPDDSSSNNTTKEPAADNLSQDQQTECPICLTEFHNQMIGNPENCRHFFCVVCIKEWAKTVNSCPIDRQKFNIIRIRRSLHGDLLEEFYVDDITPGNDADQFEDPTFCQVCNQCDREDRLLLCDECDNGYHLECLTPALDVVPLDDWYCPLCTANRSSDGRIGAEERSLPNAALPRRRRERGARTAGGSARAARARRALLASGNMGADIVSRIGYRTRASSSRRGKRKRRSTSRKSKTKTGTKKKNSVARKTKTKTTRKGKTKGKRRRKIQRLEMGSDFAEDEFSFTRRPSSERRTLGSASLEPTLSFNLFGNKYDLDAFEEPEEEEEKPKQPVVKRPTRSDPDVLNQIFEGLGNLDPDNVRVERNGTLVRTRTRTAAKVDSGNDSEELAGPSTSEETISDSQTDVSLSDVKDSGSRKTDDSRESSRMLTSAYDRRLANIERSIRTSSRLRSLGENTARSRSHGHSTRLNGRDNAARSVDIRSWRDERKSDANSYKPLPSAAKFRNVKIPKLKRSEENNSNSVASSSRHAESAGFDTPIKISRIPSSKSTRPNSSGKLPLKTISKQSPLTNDSHTYIPTRDSLTDFRIPKKPKSNPETSKVKVKIEETTNLDTFSPVVKIKTKETAIFDTQIPVAKVKIERVKIERTAGLDTCTPVVKIKTEETPYFDTQIPVAKVKSERTADLNTCSPVVKIKTEETCDSLSEFRIPKKSKPNSDSCNPVVKVKREETSPSLSNTVSTVSKENINDKSSTISKGNDSDEDIANEIFPFESMRMPSKDNLNDFRIPKVPSRTGRASISTKKGKESSTYSSARVTSEPVRPCELIGQTARNMLAQTQSRPDEAQNVASNCKPRATGLVSNYKRQSLEGFVSVNVKAEPIDNNKVSNLNHPANQSISDTFQTEPGQSLSQSNHSMQRLDPRRQARRNIGLLNMIRQRKSALKQQVDELSNVYGLDVENDHEAIVCQTETAKHENRDAKYRAGAKLIKTEAAEHEVEAKPRGSVSSGNTSSAANPKNQHAEPVRIDTSPSHHVRYDYGSMPQDKPRRWLSSGQHIPLASDRPVAMVSPSLRLVSEEKDLDMKPKRKDGIKSKIENKITKEEDDDAVSRMQRMVLAEHECKKALKPYFKSRVIDKNQYKYIMKKAVEKICSSQRTIETQRVENLIAKYVGFTRNSKTMQASHTETKKLLLAMMSEEQREEEGPRPGSREKEGSG